MPPETWLLSAHACHGTQPRVTSFPEVPLGLPRACSLTCLGESESKIPLAGESTRPATAVWVCPALPYPSVLQGKQLPCHSQGQAGGSVHVSPTVTGTRPAGCPSVPVDEEMSGGALLRPLFPVGGLPAA